MQFLSKEGINEAKKRVGDDPFVFKNDYLKFIKDEQLDLLLWLANYSNIKFDSDPIANNWFSFGGALIFALFDFEIHMYKKLEKKLISKKVIHDSFKDFQNFDDLKKYYQNLREKEPFLFNFTEDIRGVAKKLQNEGREKIKHEDVFMVVVCYVYKMFVLTYEI